MEKFHENSTYSYASLPGNDFIRILVLKPSTDRDAPLRISLQIAQLDHDDYPYDAMSYTWGEPVFSQTLYIETTPPNEDLSNRGLYSIGITSNLSKMLRYMRDPFHSRRLWVDAICINQQDDKEKSMQIPLMFRIFQQAFRVAIWLGDNTEDQRRMRLLSIFSRRRVRHDGTVSTTSHDDLQAAGEAVYRLNELPWFSRLWIVQEAVVNTDVTMYCGREEISLVRLFDIAKDMHSLSEHQPARLQSLSEMENLWNEYARGHALDISSRRCNGSRPCPTIGIVERFEHFGCADPRDRVYAISTLQKCMRIVPDYRLSPEEVFVNFACSMRDHGQLQWVLREAAIRQNGTRTPGLPSWVPDLRIQPIRRPIFTKHLQIGGEYLGDATDVSASQQEDGSDAICFTDYHFYKDHRGVIYKFRLLETQTWYDVWESRFLRRSISARLRIDPFPMIATWRGDSFPDRPKPVEAKAWMKTTLELVWKQFATRLATVSPHTSERLARKECIATVASTLVADGANIGDLHPSTSKEAQKLSDSIVDIFNHGKPSGNLFSDGYSQLFTRCLQEIVEETVDQTSMTDAFIQLVIITMQGRCFFTCDIDEVPEDIRAPIACGIGPSHLQIGDQALLHYMPFWEQAYLMRACGRTEEQSPSCFELVGDCYLKEPMAWECEPDPMAWEYEPDPLAWEYDPDTMACEYKPDSKELEYIFDIFHLEEEQRTIILK